MKKGAAVLCKGVCINGPWRNDACLGYARIAMQRQGLDEKTIQAVLQQMAWEFDEIEVEEAARLDT